MAATILNLPFIEKELNPIIILGKNNPAIDD
jgi:hypothetical protein